MFNRVYRLVASRTIEPVELSVVVDDSVVVRPTYLSICNADQRYYQGRRPARIMAKKLPMALIHEGIGQVAHDPSGMFTPGQHVIMLPNNPIEEEDDLIAENYLQTSQFCGSGFDGFMQELCILPAYRVLPLPKHMNLKVASFTELVSVAVHAVTRFDSIAHSRRNTIGVWGDGNLGFIVSLVARTMFPQSHIVVFGRNDYKLADFTFADETFLTSEIPNNLMIDHAFECCGGEGSTHAIEQIIELINPEGTVSLLGVSENPVPLNTRMILEKGLRFFGSSRSGRADFERTLALYHEHPEMVDYLNALVGAIIPVRTIKDIATAFETDARKSMGKTIMEWTV